MKKLNSKKRHKRMIVVSPLSRQCSADYKNTIGLYMQQSLVRVYITAKPVFLDTKLLCNCCK